jgi:hypothetical protein
MPNTNPSVVATNEEMADEPVSRILWAGLQTNKLFGINRR